MCVRSSGDHEDKGEAGLSAKGDVEKGNDVVGNRPLGGKFMGALKFVSPVTELSSQSHIRMASSTYWRSVTPPETKCGATLLMYPICFALSKVCDNAYAARLNSSGESGSPCRSPLCVLKYVPFSSFILMHTLSPRTVLMI